MRQLLQFEGIDDNFQFLVLEVTKQLEDTRTLLEHPAQVAESKIVNRDDYIDNLKSVIENKAYANVLRGEHVDKQTLDRIRAVNTITSNLERIADFATNVVAQTHHFRDPSFIARFQPGVYFEVILAALAEVVDALFSADVAGALRICRAEFKLDSMYKTALDQIIAELRTGRDTENLVTTLFIIRYFERMGDSLLNIGEAIISSAVGEKLKIHQYQALEETLEAADMNSDLTELTFDAIWETRSGCRIGRIRDANGSGKAKGVIFKDGRRVKLQKEKENIERWEHLLPGFPPKVIDFHTNGDHATILLENLQGKTFQDWLLNGQQAQFEGAFALIQEKLADIWASTKKPVPVNAGFIRQLASRVEEVYKVHPDFRVRDNTIGPLEAPSFDDLIERARPIDKALSAPFSCLIHGDLNIDNLMYNAQDRRLHVIDLHRSSEQDYVQDVSVFLVSNFRLPVFEPTVRGRINMVSLTFYQFARQFAQEHGDKTFDARLTLGLIRSFVTSTRFQLHHKFANAMYLRAVFLLEKVLAQSGESFESFRLPEEVLTY